MTSQAPRIILASTSPRRRELLAHLGLPYDVVGSAYDEEAIPFDPADPGGWTLTLARGKALAVAAQTEGDAVVIGADTTVVLDGQVYNKPLDAADAARMLRTLSGRTHQVYTGVVAVPVEGGVITPDSSAYGVTDVTFKPLTDKFIAEYVATGEPLDKAGAYGIQNHGLALIDNIQGDYYNVVGFPLHIVRDLLAPYYPDIAPAPPQPAFPAENHGNFSRVSNPINR
jgi:septum formation protein